MTTPHYAVARELDPATGDLRMHGVAWKRGAPLTEIVLRVLRTPRGSFLPKPTFGVDYSLVQKLTPASRSLWRAGVEAALRYLVDSGRMRDLQVIVDPPAGGRMLYAVDFVDVRQSERTQLRLQT
jgi:phage baseplate assembly protein W